MMNNYSERNVMTLLTAIITQKPHLGFFATAGGLAAGILAWLQVISLSIGILGAIFGATAGFF